VLNATASIRLLDNVLPASEDMTSLRESVSFPLPILLPQLISAVETGIGIIKNALAAPRDGHSMLITSVYLLLINAQLMDKMVLAFHAIKDMI
jgi:hypothetical protein